MLAHIEAPIADHAHEEWFLAHRALTRLAKARAQQDYEEVGWLLAARRAKTHSMLGFASIIEYLERIFGWSPRLAHEKLRVAEALERLPAIAQALRDGAVSWSSVRELTRVATEDTETEWLEATHAHTLRQVEQQVAGRKPGDRPSDRARPELRKHLIHAEVSGETMALWREALMTMQKNAGSSISEEEAIRLLARTALGGPQDAGRAPHQIVISRCPDCGRVTQRGRGEDFEVSAIAAEAAECDAQRVDLREAKSGAVPHAAQHIPPAVRRMVLLRDRGRCVVPGCAHTAYLAIHHVTLRSEGGTHDPDQLVTLCDAHHMRVHDGRLIIEGIISKGLHFRHADGTPYGGKLSPGIAGMLGETFAALTALGFRQGESRAALNVVRAHVDTGGTLADVASTLKMALRHLHNARGSASMQ